MPKEYAFPSTHPVIERGMTLRDYFAATIMQALVTRGYVGDHKAKAKYAYEAADAMMAERNA